jgi:hypothetical protein
MQGQIGFGRRKGGVGPAGVASCILLPGRRKGLCEFVDLVLEGLVGEGEAWTVFGRRGRRGRWGRRTWLVGLVGELVVGVHVGEE